MASTCPLTDAASNSADPINNLRVLCARLEREGNRMKLVVDAARCIRHWHDRENGGMVVSGEHVMALWQALHDLDEASNAEVNGAPLAERPL